jgi:hypothetical protein
LALFNVLATLLYIRPVLPVIRFIGGGGSGFFTSDFFVSVAFGGFF